MKTFLAARVLLLAAVAASPCPDDAPTPEQLLPMAQKLAEQKPTAAHWVGLAEMQRAAGRTQDALDTLLRAAATPEGRDDAGLRNFICWRMIPAGTGDHDDYRKQVALLKEQEPAGGWAGVHELLLAYAAGDRAALIAAAAKGDAAPKAFPAAMAEKAHLDLLVELGLPRTRAGLEVAAARSYESLYALRDLDRWMTREADFLRSERRDADAKTVESCRDRLREAWLSASRRLVERLFALNLLGRAQERAALLAAVDAVPYLSDRQNMQTVLARLDETQVWSLVVEPLLTNEARLIEAPPDLTHVKAPAAAELAVQADRKTVRDGTTVYEGGVKVSVGPLRIACDRLSLLRDGDSGPAVLAGSGGVSVEGLPGFPGGARADRFTYGTDAGAFTFGGDVRLGRPDGVLKLRACTVSRAGEVGDRRSLLDDFHDADTAGRLELLPRISKVYSDDELPGEVKYLLALSLLRPHLTWHAPYPPPKRDEKDTVADREGAAGHRRGLALGAGPRRRGLDAGRRAEGGARRPPPGAGADAGRRAGAGETGDVFLAHPGPRSSRCRPRPAALGGRPRRRGGGPRRWMA